MSSTSGQLSERTVTRRLTRRYTLALATIVVLAVLGQIVVQLSLAEQSSDARVINIAALQNTLSERMCKAALAIIVGTEEDARGPYVRELRDDVAQWQSTQIALQRGDPALGLPGQNSPQVDHLFAQIAPSFNTMLDGATQILITIDNAPPVQLPTTPALIPALVPQVQRILSAEPDFVVGMNVIIAQYQREAEGRVARLQIVEWGLLAVVLLDVILIALLVLRPATRSVGRSIADLVRAQERERELAALKDQFIIDANHELRTPIMALYNNLEVMDALSQRGTSDQRERVLRRALASGDAVIRLLTRVLDTAALEGKAPRLEPQPLALASMVHSVLETFDPREIGEASLQTGSSESRPVTVHIEPELRVQADEGRLRQVLTNLVGNALKYSAPGTPIGISAFPHASAEGGGRRRGRGRQSDATSGAEQIQISVRDHGLGVPPREIPKLFNRFVRLERDIAGTVRGTGVGLYMCRVLVEAMGGRIWVESSGVPGEGSTFSFTLPEAPAEMIGEAASPASASVTAPALRPAP
jgi:signal transduction histidine kinase